MKEESFPRKKKAFGSSFTFDFVSFKEIELFNTQRA